MWNIILVEIVIFTALYTDLKSNKIPNILTFPAMIMGLLVNYPQGLSDSFFGMMLVFAAYLPVYAMGAVAAGDVKILMVIGITMGYRITFLMILITIIINLMITTFILIKNKNFTKVIKDTHEELKFRLLMLLHKNKKDIIDKPRIEAKTMIPYMPAIVIGVNLALILL